MWKARVSFSEEMKQNKYGSQNNGREDKCAIHTDERKGNVKFSQKISNSITVNSEDTCIDFCNNTQQSAVERNNRDLNK